MKLELSIADDRELRNFIKDMIRGEVVSIARGEIKSIIADVVKEGIVPKSSEELKDILQKEISELVRGELLGGTYTNPHKIQLIAREEVQKWLKELSSHLLSG